MLRITQQIEQLHIHMQPWTHLIIDAN
jgi:hypothetical protein